MMTSRFRMPASRMIVLLFMALVFLPSPVSGQDSTGPFISLDVRFDENLLPDLKVEFLCSSGTVRSREIKLQSSQQLQLEIPDFVDQRTSCQLIARLPVGHSATYSVSGESAGKADKNGCQYSQVASGHSNSCGISVNQDPVFLTVYKEWVGPSGEEEDVRISLECESGDYSGFRYVNAGAPDGWEIRNIVPEGILCNVSEEVRDTYRPDIIDCQGLWILPGKGEECTLVNTKIVKRIEALNRYGKIIMIILVLAVGLVAARRFS